MNGSGSVGVTVLIFNGKDTYYCCCYYYYYYKLNLHSLLTLRHHLDAPFFLFRPIVPSNPALPSWKMLVFVFYIVRGTPHTLPWLGLIGMGESLRRGACTVSMIELIKV
jgi:hypothetical protein